MKNANMSHTAVTSRILNGFMALGGAQEILKSRGVPEATVMEKSIDPLDAVQLPIVGHALTRLEKELTATAT